MKNLSMKLKLLLFNLRIISIELIITFVIVAIVILLSIFNYYVFNINQNNHNNKIESTITTIYNRPIITPITTIIPRNESLISRGGSRETSKPNIKPTPIKDKTENRRVNENKVKNKDVDFKYVDSGVYYVTMYTLHPNECGKQPWHKEYGFGSSGIKVRARESVAMGRGIPYNTKIKIEGFENTYTNHDTGSRIYNNCVDVFTYDLKMSNRFGRQKRKVWILSWGNGKVK